MDVDELRGLAAQLGGDVNTLSGLITTVNGLAGELVLLWNGPASVTFEQDWQSRYRPALLAAYGTLSSLHAHLVNNISQQTSASTADGGWTAARAFGDLEDGIKLIGTVGLPLGIIGELGSAATDHGGASGLSKAWSYATDDHLFGLSPDDVGWVKSTAGFLEDSHIDDGLKVAGLAGSAIGVYHVMQDSYRASEDLDDGNYVGAANEFADGVADGLQAYPSPVTYLAGVDVKLLDQVANLDWKDTPSPFSGSNFQQDYLPVLKSEFTTAAGLKEAGKTLWGDM
jgi:uncharacterized protein YukE